MHHLYSICTLSCKSVEFRKTYSLLYYCFFAEVAAFRSELEHIRVKGRNCPTPVKTWAQTGLSIKLLNALKKYL